MTSGSPAFVAAREKVLDGVGLEGHADRQHAQLELVACRLPVPEGKDVLYRDAFRSMLRMLKAQYDAGIPSARVLQASTLGGARVMNLDRDLGSVAGGSSPT